MNEGWIVLRVEASGEISKTCELTEIDANSRYANWCENAKRFNDRSVSLVKITRSEDVIATHHNTSFNPAK